MCPTSGKGRLSRIGERVFLVVAWALIALGVFTTGIQFGRTIDLEGANECLSDRLAVLKKTGNLPDETTCIVLELTKP